MLFSTIYALCGRSRKIAPIFMPLLVVSLAAALLSVQGPTNELGRGGSARGHLVQLKRWSPRLHRPAHVFRKLTDNTYTAPNWAGWCCLANVRGQLFERCSVVWSSSAPNPIMRRHPDSVRAD